MSAPLRIAVDGRSLAGGPARGVAHYLAALLEALGRLYPDDVYRVVLPRGGAVHARAPLPDAVEVPVPGRLLFGAAALTGRPRLDRLAGGCDVAWVPAPAPLAVSPGVPLVLTVQDRSWERRPQDFTAYERLWHAAARPRALARRAACVLTTTEVGRADVVAAWGLEPRRVRAVGLAPAVAPAVAAAAGLGLPGGRGELVSSRPPQVASTPGVPGTRGADAAPYLLFVGALEPRKGPDVLARALELARPRGFETRVVVVGSGRLDGLLRMPGVEAAGRLTDAGLSRLYAGAEALVVPSRLEGYGLPAVEALAHGTPVIGSDLPEAREVLGDAATYVPADDPEALARALLAPRAAAPAPPPASRRSWDEVAHRTREALACG